MSQSNESLIAEKDAAIRYLETAIAVRDQFIYRYQSRIFELHRKLKEALDE